MTHEINVGLAVWLHLLNRLSIMMSVSAIVIIYALLLGISTKNKRPLGVIFFGVFLILGSIYKLWGFLDYDYYRFMFQQLPESMVFMRYLGSVALRLVGLVAATGILMLNNISRKIFIALCLLTLCFIYWKHPFFVFENISRFTERIFFHTTGAGELTYPWRPWVSLIVNYTIDIIFCGSSLIYFTRPKVKQQFH